MTTSRVRRNRHKPLEVVSELTPSFPLPRDEWLPETAASWKAFEGSQVASLLDLGVDAMALYRLFDLYDERARARRVTWAEPLVEGSHGQMMLHPLLRRIAAIDRELLALEDRFGMSPKARLALGISITDGGGTLDDLNARFQSS